MIFVPGFGIAHLVMKMLESESLDTLIMFGFFFPQFSVGACIMDINTNYILRQVYNDLLESKQLFSHYVLIAGIVWHKLIPRFENIKMVF